MSQTAPTNTKTDSKSGPSQPANPTAEIVELLAALRDQGLASLREHVVEAHRPQLDQLIKHMASEPGTLSPPAPDFVLVEGSAERRGDELLFEVSRFGEADLYLRVKEGRVELYDPELEGDGAVQGVVGGLDGAQDLASQLSKPQTLRGATVLPVGLATPLPLVTFCNAIGHQDWISTCNVEALGEDRLRVRVFGAPIRVEASLTPSGRIEWIHSIKDRAPGEFFLELLNRSAQ